MRKASHSAAQNLGCEVLERSAEKFARSVLRRGEGGNTLSLFDVESHRYDPSTDTVWCEGILNMSKRCWDIVEVFGPICEKYYS